MAKKYIDAERLRTEIERFSSTEYNGNTLGDDVVNGALDYVLEEIIPYLQQEQPEVDLEKEIEKFCLEYDARKEVWFDMTPMDQKMLSTPTWSNFAANIARHFYELGLNTRK